jgi:hypothetical protein
MVKTTSVESGSIETPGEKIWIFAYSCLQLEIGAHPVSGPPSRESDVIQSRDTVGTTSVVAGVLENRRKTAGMSNLSQPLEIEVRFRFGGRQVGKNDVRCHVTWSEPLPSSRAPLNLPE